MEDTGVPYNVRMRLGQGYNSYIQEPRIDNAVAIRKTFAVSPNKAASTDATNASKTATSDSINSQTPDGPFTLQALTDWLTAADRSGSSGGADQ